MRVSQIALHEQGPICSRLTLGVWRMADWQMSTQEIQAWIEGCLELGITTFDHADIYGDYTCEGLFGAVLKADPSLRDRMQLISKCGIKLVSPNRPTHTIKHYDTSRAHILASVENSLTQLHTDRLDLLLLHRPDPLMDADEVADAFITLKQSGKVLHFGVSNFSPSQVDLLASRLDFPLVTNQIELSVMQRDAFQNGVLDQCQRLRMAPMAWSPFGGGELFNSKTSDVIRLRDTLSAIAQDHDASLDQVALAWLLAHPARIVPTLGTRNLDRVRSAVGSESVHLTREQWFAILTAATGRDVP